jgi:hypothetical protein
MVNEFFKTFAPTLRDMSMAALLSEIERPARLLIAAETWRGRQLEIAYSPFDHVNLGAEVVIVGLTPGRQQMRNALVEARRCLMNGMSEDEAMRAAKTFASFSGPMRTNLIALLDSIAVNRALKLSSASSLWAVDSQRVHFTSALRYPVFIDGENYSGAPSILSTPLLKTHLMQWFAKEMAMLPNAIFIPLGPKVTEAVEAVAMHLGLSTNRVLSGLPHPSGANAERIAFFLGRKNRADVSLKVDADRLVAARASLDTKIANWA